jgi:hypothetical protein
MKSSVGTPDLYFSLIIGGLSVINTLLPMAILDGSLLRYASPIHIYSRWSVWYFKLFSMEANKNDAVLITIGIVICRIFHWAKHPGDWRTLSLEIVRYPILLVDSYWSLHTPIHTSPRHLAKYVCALVNHEWNVKKNANTHALTLSYPFTIFFLDMSSSVCTRYGYVIENYTIFSRFTNTASIERQTPRDTFVGHCTNWRIGGWVLGICKSGAHSFYFKERYRITINPTSLLFNFCAHWLLPWISALLGNAQNRLK